jgi:formate hydrogenlyase subunit 4
MNTIKNLSLLVLLNSLFFLTGCSNTFAGSLLVVSFSDIIYYVIIALVISGIIALFKPENRRKSFWIWFILSLILTPLAGLIYLLIIITRKK